MKTYLDRSDSRAHFVVAEVPPLYEEALEQLGFSRQDAWFVRSFPVDIAGIEIAHASFARNLDEMVLQTARLKPTSWQEALNLFLGRIKGEEIDWWLTGSGALAVRGLNVAPRDLDLVVDDDGASRLGELRLDALVEPVHPADWFCNRWGRAFLAARVEWVGGVGPSADEPLPTDFGLVAAASLQRISWFGHTIRVPPLELQLQVTNGAASTIASSRSAHRSLRKPLVLSGCRESAPAQRTPGRGGGGGGVRAVPHVRASATKSVDCIARSIRIAAT